MPSSPAEEYINSILGQQAPSDALVESSSGVSTFMSLLQVDSKWNRGQYEEAEKLLLTLQKNKIIHCDCQHFFNGINALLEEKLSLAYDSFVNASMSSKSDLEKTFFSERAVNIAFWMACSGQMMSATKGLDIATPFTGGIVSFSQYMNSQIVEAEQTARSAMEAGFQDPWTVHAVAHALQAQGKAKDCAQFLEEQRSRIQSCNPSTFMKGHMEFHLALCFIEMEEVVRLNHLVGGALWGSLSELERQDYWNAAGLLNILWKAELQGLDPLPLNAIILALETLKSANPTRSTVFALCILRWTTGDRRSEWRETLMKNDNQTVKAMTAAIDLIYPVISFEKAACAHAVSQYLQPYCSGELHTLGASPEQREVLDDFLKVVSREAAKS